MESTPKEYLHANRRFHNDVCEVEHGAGGHGDEVAVAVVIHSFNESLQLKERVRLQREKKATSATHKVTQRERPWRC